MRIKLGNRYNKSKIENKVIFKRVVFIIIVILILLIPIKYFIHSNEVTVKDRRVPYKENYVVKNELDYDSPIDDLRKNYNNKDIKAKLVIAGIGIDTVITKGTNNEFYLRHNAYRERSDFGNPYLDYRNYEDLGNERQVNIYSHNFYDKRYIDYLPFSKLEAYLNEETFNSSKEILLYTDKELLRYEVYAIKIVTKVENEHMIMDAKTDELWKEHLDKLLTNTKYCNSDCSLDGNSQLLILQTCNYQPNGSFLLVIARKVVK